MRTKLVGIHKVKRKLSDGTVRIHYYAWRGGPKIDAEPDTRRFTEEFIRLTRDREDTKTSDIRTIRWLIREYRKSQAFLGLADRSRSDYERHMIEIEAEFHDLPLSIVGDVGMRSEFVTFRDRYAATPRRADLIMAVLRRMLSFALDREWITRNPVERVEELAEGTRREEIWTDKEIATFKTIAPEYMVRALMLALWTGQRQGDLLRLSWSAYDGQHIRLRQSKTRRNVRIKIAKELKAVLDAAKTENEKREVPATTILTTASGKPWKTGFKGAWRKMVAKAKISGKTFHDLRGTFCTLAYRSGASFKEIAEASGHSETEAERIIRAHYLAGDTVISKLEKRTVEE
ncbi:tyrosine-type recombinase/integrase [Phyllobacterium phragmitis]|nr:tyrosine-type recombinase/integrase [Phyllobacterium phragmitis]